VFQAIHWIVSGASVLLARPLCFLPATMLPVLVSKLLASKPYVQVPRGEVSQLVPIQSIYYVTSVSKRLHAATSNILDSRMAYVAALYVAITCSTIE
jgi:hypothetical protein